MIPGFRLAGQHFLANSCGFAHETMGSFASALHHVGGTHICCLKRQWLAGNHGFSVKASQPHEHGWLHNNQQKRVISLCRFCVHYSSHTRVFDHLFRNCLYHGCDSKAQHHYNPNNGLNRLGYMVRRTCSTLVDV